MYEGANLGNIRQGIGRDEAANQGSIVTIPTGDSVFFEELLRGYEADVMRVALNVTGSLEAAQGIYCRVFRDAYVSIHELQQTQAVFVWIYRILVRHCLEFCRRDRQAQSLRDYGSDFANRLRRAILELTPTEQIIFELKQHQGLKIETLAEIFNASPDFIIHHLENAIFRVRKQSKRMHGAPAAA